MSSIRRFSLVSAALLAFCGHPAFADRKPGDTVATAKILVINHGATQKSNSDIAATQQAILKSRAVVERAARSKKLGDLEKLVGDKGIEAIFEGLRVERDPTASEMVFNLSMSGVTPEAGVTVLEAVVEAYRQQLTDVYPSSGDKLSQYLQVLCVELEKKAKEAEKRYLEINNENQLSPLADSITILTKKCELAAQEIAKKEILWRATAQKLEQCKKMVSTDKGKQELLTDVAEWAKEKNVLAETATIESYLAYLSRQLDATRATIQKIEEMSAEAADKIREHNDSILKETAAKNDRDRVRQLFNVVLTQAEAIKIQKDRGGFQVAYISKPAAVKK
jgi:hypothetical protein